VNVPAAGVAPAAVRVRRWLAVHRLDVIVVVAALAFYTYAWSVQSNRPQLAALRDDPHEMFVITETGPVAPPELAGEVDAQARRYGWYGAWYDQFHYAQMARDLARGDLPGTAWDHVAVRPESGEPYRTAESGYLYGLGYSLLAVPFVWAGFGGDPFVVLDGLLLATCALLTARIGRRFLPEGVAAVVALAVVVATPSTRYFVIPYGTSVTTVAVLAALAALVAPRIGRAQAGLTAAAIAACAAARYVDVVWPLLVVGLALLLRRPGVVRLAVVTVAAVAVTVVLVAWTHHLVFGSVWDTPYDFHNDGLDTSRTAYEPSRIPDAFVGVFLSGEREQLFGVDPILRAAPWLALAPLGLVVLFRERDPLRWAMTATLGVAAVATLQYLAWFFGGTENLRIWVIRFYQPWFPLCAVLAAIGVRWVVAPRRAADPPTGELRGGPVGEVLAEPGVTVP
jgi:hypothetical protein